jgi:hypothetical protein
MHSVCIFYFGMSSPGEPGGHIADINLDYNIFYL